MSREVAVEHESKRDQALRERARRVIPGGMYGHQSVATLPPGFPQYFVRAEGCRLWDADGNEYIDYLCGYGPNLLGYRHPEVERAAAEQAAQGDCMTGPSPRMVELAERFVELIEHAGFVMFCKNGTDATTSCLMIARAHTGRRKVLRARGAYHGAAPWCTPIKHGVLPSEREHFISYDYNDIASLEQAVASAGDDLCAILASPIRHDAYRDQELPSPAFARRARELCDAKSALLILDEVRAGLRLRHGCSWQALGVRPDLSAWGKTLANGHPLSLVAGSEALREAASVIYVTGSYWFSAVPMAASLATLEIARRERVIEHIERLGTQLREGIASQARAHSFGLRQTGPVQMPLMLFDDDPELARGNRFVAEAVKRGVYLHPWHNMFLCAAHTERDIARTLEVTEDAFAALRRAGV
ncbi:MAG: aminotransferase class III-fold pyridoxal phosphate-dependent enzyme [Polyangiales bacterium]